jgi:isocitrate/isopropylmalate dehydrogenase
MSQRYKILGLLGDGIAGEIITEGLKVLEAIEDRYELNLEILGPYPVGAKYWVDHDLKRG